MISVVFEFLRRLSPMTLALGGIIIVLLGVVAKQAIEIHVLDGNIESCNGDRAGLQADLIIHHAQVDELLAAIEEQNNEVRRLGVDTAKYELAAQVAQENAGEDRRLRLAAIADLMEASGSSCVDGIALIDKELGL